MYRNLSTSEEKEEFFGEYGTQWTEFARLDYFDLVRYTVVCIIYFLVKLRCV
jgi:hypothetical protein